MSFLSQSVSSWEWVLLLSDEGMISIVWLMVSEFKVSFSIGRFCFICSVLWNRASWIQPRPFVYRFASLASCGGWRKGGSLVFDE